MTNPTAAEISAQLIALGNAKETEITIKGTRWVVYREEGNYWRLTKMNGYLIASVIEMSHVSAEQAVASMTLLS